jgi:hypothetical protein
VSGKIGQGAATYHDVNTLPKSTADNKPWSLGLVFAHALPSETSFVSMGWDRRKTGKEQDPTARCPTDATSPTVE